MLTAVWTQSRRQFEKRMNRADREIAKALKKQTRKAGGVIRKNVRKRIRASFRGRHGPLRRNVRPGGRAPGLLAKSIQVSVRAKRKPRLLVTAVVLPSNKKKFFPAKLYYPGLERGGVIRRRQARSGSKIKRGPHVARYTAKPTFVPGVKASEREVYRLIGKTFDVV